MGLVGGAAGKERDGERRPQGRAAARSHLSPPSPCVLAAGDPLAGEALVDLDEAGVVDRAEALGRRHHHHLKGGRGHRQRHAQVPADAEHHAQVLDPDVAGAARREVVIEHVRHPVVEHPGAAGGVPDHLVQHLGIGAERGPKRHALGGGHQVDAGEQLIDRLDARADARGVAQAIDRPGARLERRVGRRERFGRARGHDGELALLGGDRAAAHRRIEQMQPALAQACGEIAHEARRHRAREHHGRAGRQRRGGAVVAEQHRLDLGVIDHHDEQQPSASRRLGRGGRPGAAPLREPVHRLPRTSWPVTAKPARHRLAAMPKPIAPSPMKPIWCRGTWFRRLAERSEPGSPPEYHQRYCCHALASSSRQRLEELFGQPSFESRVRRLRSGNPPARIAENDLLAGGSHCQRERSLFA